MGQFWGIRMGNARHKFRAIVIDEMDFCRDLLTDVLESRGYHVLSFPDVTSCSLFSSQQSSCQKHAPCSDFLLLDKLMPHMNGLDFLALQQQNNCLLKIERKAIFSADWTPHDLARAKQLKCQSFDKPYHFDKLSIWLDEQEKRIASNRVLADLKDVIGETS